MKSSWTVRFPAPSERVSIAPDSLAEGRPEQPPLVVPTRRGILKTRQWLLENQQDDGHWVAELEGDTILESEYILLLAYLGEVDTPPAKRAARYILEQQLPEGGWAIFPGGPIEISASVKAYFALKLTGHDPSDEPMQRARAAILSWGGADAVNSFTRFYLALLGQISYDNCPTVPPEMALLPKWMPGNLYQVSAWSRTMIVTLSLMSARRPVAQIDARHGIRELFLRPASEWPATRCPGLEQKKSLFSWGKFFHMVDRGMKFCERHKLLPLRRRAIAAAEKWMLDRFERSDGLGAIFPPMVWSIIAMKALGYENDSPPMKYARERLEGLAIDENDTRRLQPCKSPVWDSAISMLALSDSGLEPDHPAMRRGYEWLLSQQIKRPGDWSETVACEPGGWCFEYANDFYPDVDDTAMVSMALNRRLTAAKSRKGLPPGFSLVSEESIAQGEQPCDTSPSHETAEALARAEVWLLAMQNRDGGWGAFDRDNDNQFLCHVPFADHNAMIDPSTPDLCARVLEALGQRGLGPGHPAVDRGLAYLRKTQEADGSWFGRWGVNYIYGTWQVLQGLQAIGIPHNDPMVEAAAAWLLAYQQPCGGWGETPNSYAEPSLRGQGNPTPSQTAWALLGLTAAGLEAHPAVARGVRYLLDTQDADGSWEETDYTGTGFPQVFYLRYTYYRIYFPLMALSRWAVAIEKSGAGRTPAAVERPRERAMAATGEPLLAG